MESILCYCFAMVPGLSIAILYVQCSYASDSTPIFCTVQQSYAVARRYREELEAQYLKPEPPDPPVFMPKGCAPKPQPAQRPKLRSLGFRGVRYPCGFV